MQSFTSVLAAGLYRNPSDSKSSQFPGTLLVILVDLSSAVV